MPYQIEIKKINDVNRIYSLLKRLFVPQRLEKIGDVFSYAGKLAEKAVFLVGIYKEMDAGFLAYYYNSAEKEMYVTALAVDKNLGLLSSRVMVNLLRYGYNDKRDYHVVRIEVDRDNVSALKLYRRVGFSCVEEKENSLIMTMDKDTIRATLPWVEDM